MSAFTTTGTSGIRKVTLTWEPPGIVTGPTDLTDQLIVMQYDVTDYMPNLHLEYPDLADRDTAAVMMQIVLDDVTATTGPNVDWEPCIPERVEKHYGPGSHPGTGTGQDVHGSSGRGTPDAPSMNLFAGGHNWRPITSLSPEFIHEATGALRRYMVGPLGDNGTFTAAPRVKDKVVRSLHATLKDNPDIIAATEAFWENPHTGETNEVQDLDLHYHEGGSDVGENRILNYIDALVGEWALSAADHRPRAIAFQVAAAKELGIKPSEFLQEEIATYQDLGFRLKDLVEPILAGEQPGMRAFVHEVYVQTQAELAAAGVPEQVVVFRGMRWEEYGQQIPEIAVNVHDANGKFLHGDSPAAVMNGFVTGNPLQSWTARWKIAKDFTSSGGIILAAHIPRSSFISTARTGWGALNEYEVILAEDGDDEVTWMHPDYSPDITQTVPMKLVGDSYGFFDEDDDEYDE